MPWKPGLAGRAAGDTDTRLDSTNRCSLAWRTHVRPEDPPRFSRSPRPCWSSGASRPGPSGAHGPKTYYRVKPYDTLWSIAQAHYGGDVRNAVWQIQQANHLGGSGIAPGERLLLP